MNLYKKLLGVSALGLFFYSLPQPAYSLSECKGSPLKLKILKIKISKWNNCYGTLINRNGDKYIGDFNKGNLYGQGTYIYSNGDKYVGEWKKGKYFGDGTYTYANGDQYIGEWKKNKYNKPDNLSGRSGQGTYIYANGDKYVGKWKIGLKHGKGTFTYSNGEVEKGIWKNDKFVKRK